MSSEHPQKKPAIDFTVDNEPQTTNEADMTPNQVLKAAGLDPTTSYLVQLEGNHQGPSYQGKGDVPIHIHEHERFISLAIGPTPLS